MHFQEQKFSITVFSQNRQNLEDDGKKRWQWSFCFCSTETRGFSFSSFQWHADKNLQVRINIYNERWGEGISQWKRFTSSFQVGHVCLPFSSPLLLFSFTCVILLLKSYVISLRKAMNLHSKIHVTNNEYRIHSLIIKSAMIFGFYTLAVVCPVIYPK